MIHSHSISTPNAIEHLFWSDDATYMAIMRGGRWHHHAVVHAFDVFQQGDYAGDLHGAVVGLRRVALAGAEPRRRFRTGRSKCAHDPAPLSIADHRRSGRDEISDARVDKARARESDWRRTARYFGNALISSPKSGGPGRSRTRSNERSGNFQSAASKMR